MRQFVFGLVVAGLLWWGYDKWTSDDSHVDGPSAPPAAADGAANGAASSRAANGSLDQLLANRAEVGTSGGQQATGPQATGPQGGEPKNRQPSAQALDASATASPLTTADLAELLPRVAAGEPEAIACAWTAVATGRLGGEQGRVLAALQPKADDFASQLAALGTDNSALHSREGRAAAEKAVAAGMSLPDPEAVKAGSQLLYVMTRGRIAASDTEVRAAVDQAYAQHRIRVDRWLCNPANVAGARSYTVASGDSLARIAGKFRSEGLQVESGTLAVLNRIHNPNALQVGQKLKIPMAAIVAVVEKRSFAMLVFVGDELLRLYWVGHGENDRTPVTEFTVLEKQPRPQWTAPDGNVYPYGHKQNILGEYFIKFGHPHYTGFGAHGTPMPETICTQSSMGCIRMYAPDIAELFELLPRGGKVVIRATESLRG